MRKFDCHEAKLLNAEQWQINLMDLNPPYCSWGPHEDYMSKSGDGWDSRVLVETWSDFSEWTLDDYNECVGFYFEVNRKSDDCVTCGGNGYHPDAQHIVNTFYSHTNKIGIRWCDDITQEEVQALVDEDRLIGWTHKCVAGQGWIKKCPEYVPTAAEVNAAQKERLVHDAINRSILTETRLKRFGIPVVCPSCDGRGITFTEPTAHVSLVLWWLHPRKGCSRGIEIKRIERSDLPSIRDFLLKAAERNVMRFSGAQALPTKDV